MEDLIRDGMATAILTAWINNNKNVYRAAHELDMPVVQFVIEFQAHMSQFQLN